MKKTSILIAALITFILRAQPSYSVYPHISELSGMEDNNGNTNLFYRISSHSMDGNSWNDLNNIYNLNTIVLSDTLLFVDRTIHSNELGNNAISVTSFDFWKNNPRQYIAAKVYSGIDPNYDLINYKNENLFLSGMITLSYVNTYKNNDSIFIFVSGDNIIKYKGRGINDSYLFDTLGIFKAVSQSPFNENVFFAIENGDLYKSNDEGRTKYLVDTTYESEYQPSPLVRTIFYDKNENYIYRVVNSRGTYRLMVSNNKGEPMSWSVKFLSDIKFIAINDSKVEGLIYIALGRNIYVSTDFGNSFSLLKVLDRIVRGIYKKPGTDKLFAATANKIYEISNGNVSVIKTLPFEKDLLAYDPIQVGNKWIYEYQYADNGFIKANYQKIKEVVKDTILNDKHFMQIKFTTFYGDGTYSLDYQYERIDSNTGLVTFVKDGHEFSVDDLNITEKDTVDFSRYYPGIFTVFNNSSDYSAFNSSFFRRNYSTNRPFEDRIYSLAKNIGVVYSYRWYNEGFTDIDYLKACVINGVVYGDTTTVGVDDNNSVPAVFSLSQNYPNPFNPVTNIEYSIPAGGKVVLGIYDLLGRKISEPVNEYKNAGSYKLQFNGNGLASGVYFYKIVAGNYSDLKKFILLK